MAYWHEAILFSGALAKYSIDGRTKLVVRRDAQNPEQFIAHFLRQKNAGIFPPIEECVQLWPIEPIVGTGAKEVQADAEPLLEIAAEGKNDHLFDARPEPMPFYRKKVKEVNSPTHHALAWIAQRSENRYEVRYFGDLLGCDWETGWRIGVPLAPGEIVPEHHFMHTIADDLQSAEQAAVAELKLIVAGGEINPREHPLESDFVPL